MLLSLVLFSAASAQTVNELVEQLSAPSAEARVAAARQLGAMGEKANTAVAALAEALTDEDPSVRRAALSALREIEPGPKVGVPLMAKVLSNADPSIAIAAVQTLAESGSDGVPFLTEALKDPKARYWAALVLAEIGPDAKEAVPALLEALKEEKSPDVQREIILALGEIGSGTPDAVQALTAELDDKQDPMNVIAAAFALGKIGPDAKEAAEKLAAMMRGGDPFQRVVSAYALAEIYPDSEKVQTVSVKSLIEGLRREDPMVRLAAAKALVELQADHKILLPELKKFLDDASPEQLTESLDAFAALGEQAVPGAIRMLAYEEVRPHILGRIGPKAKAAIPALVKYLPESKPVAQSEMLLTLGNLGIESGDEAIDAIAKYTDSDDEQVRTSATYALGMIGPAAAEIAPKLRKQIEEGDDFNQLISSWALVRVTPAAEGVAELTLPHLTRGLEHSRAFVRAEAAEGLGRLGPAAKPAVPALLKALQDEQQLVQEAARAALDNIGGQKE